MKSARLKNAGCVVINFAECPPISKNATMQKSSRTLLSICAHPHPYCLCLISIISFYLYFSSSLFCFLVCNWLASVFYWKDWLVASQTPPLGVAGEIFHIPKIFSCKVAHSQIVNINCHIAILFKMCSECTTQYPRRRKKKNQHQQGGGREETLVLQEDDQLLIMQLPLSM